MCGVSTRSMKLALAADGDGRTKIVSQSELATRRLINMFTDWRLVAGLLCALNGAVVSNVILTDRRYGIDDQWPPASIRVVQYLSLPMAAFFCISSARRSKRRERCSRENVCCLMCDYVIASPRPEPLPDEIACPKCGRRFTALQYEMQYPQMWSRMP